jgi:carnitine-CoA ligase
VAALGLTLPHAVARWAEADSQRPFVIDAGGGCLSYAAMWESARRWAGALCALDVGRGDNVATALPPSGAAASCWLGMSLRRARDTGVNPAYVGRMLAYVLDNCGARVLVTTQDQLPAVDAIIGEVPNLRHVVVIGDTPVDRLGSASVVSASTLLDAADPQDGEGPAASHEIACIVYTSGTTGPAKGVLMPWGLLGASDPVWRDLTGDDVFYSSFSPHHATGRVPLVWMAPRGGTVVLRAAFRTDDFWDDVRTYECTTTQMVATMMHWLLDRPPQPDDATVPLRNMVVAPVTPRLAEFTSRFGVRARTVYGMTEIGMAISTGPETDGSEGSGRATEGFVLRVVDEHDYEVAPGDVGELIVRTVEPWRLMAGYHDMAAATAEAWRNGWFHTGDAMRTDEQGCYHFVDRIKDALRRRGENISSFEVEQLVSQHPDVRECAAVGVVADDGDQEIKIVVVREPDTTVEPRDLIAFLERTMPAFMVPRYVEFLDELPKTDATLRVRKQILRQDPLNPRTWDRHGAD